MCLFGDFKQNELVDEQMILTLFNPLKQGEALWHPLTVFLLMRPRFSFDSVTIVRE